MKATLLRRLQRLEQAEESQHYGVILMPGVCPAERWDELVAHQIRQLEIAEQKRLKGANVTTD